MDVIASLARIAQSKAAATSQQWRLSYVGQRGTEADLA
jgi:hypothetical protein